MAKNGKCDAGQYYCYTDKKCKDIPKGFMVDPKGMLRKENGHTVSEEGLRDWFGKSKSKDGKKGWVNVVTGDSCASDKPGEGIPKCVSSAKRASMSKKERKAAAAAKRREDPGQQQKSGASKPTMVKTDRKVRKEDMDINEAKDKKGKGSGSKDACYHKVKSRYSVWPSAYASGALVKCRKVGAANWGNSTKKEEYMALPEFTDLQIKAMRAAGIEVEVVDEMFKTQYGDKTKLSQSSQRKSLGRGSSIKDGSKKSGYESKKEFRDASMKFAKEETTLDEKCWKGYEKKGMKTMFGKRYPNCVKKEEVENVKEGDGDPCWDSHKQVGMKKKGNRMVPNCVPKNEEATCMGNKKGEECPIHGKKECPTLEEATRIPPRTGNIYLISFSWRGKYMNMKLFFPEVRNPTRAEIQDALDKFYPGCNLLRFDKSVFQPQDSVLNVGVSEEIDTTDWKDGYVPMEIETTDLIKPEPLQEKSAAWQRKEGKNKSGGLNEKGRKSYERENPGSDLKAPSKKKGNKRRASFCARMKGMKKKLTSTKTANDPDSRINKSLRAWNC